MGATGVQGGGHLGEQIKPVEALPSQVLAGSANGTDIDRFKYNVGEAVINIGASPTGTLDVKLQESATGGGAGYTDVTAAQMAQFGGPTFAQITIAGTYRKTMDFRGLARFVRLVYTGASTPNFKIGSVMVLGANVESYPVA
jgi:hypothetical protein